MKFSILIILTFFSAKIFPQTYNLEMENLTNLFSVGKLSPTEFTQLSRDWGDILKSFNGYPELPYNEKSGKIEFNFIKSMDRIDKKTIYDRIMEWGAINFGSLSSALHYSNFDNGKIILKGKTKLYYMNDYLTFLSHKKKEYASSMDCFFSLIFTLKDEKLKIEIVDINYNYHIPANTLTNYYIPEYDIERPIQYFYPITNGESIEWKGRLDILTKTNFVLNQFVESLGSYIKDKTNDYNF